MALIPTRETRHVLDGYEAQDLFTEGNLRTTMTEGWYSHPSLTSDVLIEREYVVLNQFGSEMHRVKEEWSYARPGGPPYEYRKEIWSKAYVPQVNTSRALKLMEEETTVFWTFAPFAPDVLAHRRQVNSWVVYNLKPNADLDSEGVSKLQERGQKADGATETEKRFHVASSQTWLEAVVKGTVVEKVDANQTAKWVTGVIVEETQVTDEPDRYTIWGTRKFALRPDHIEQIGPRYQRKPSYSYPLPVPVAPPNLEAHSAGEDGVRIVLRGGGAVVEIPLTTGRVNYDRGPEEYRVFRKKVAEAERDPVDDPWGVWDTEPGPKNRRSIIETTWVGDYDGVEDPNAGLPTQETDPEPHDPSPYVDDSWGSVGSVPNEAADPDNETGYATIYDKDVTNGSTYVYAAVAVVQGTESALSNQDEITFDGGEPRTYSITVTVNEDGSIDGDIIMPDDPGTSYDPDIGDAVDFEIPAAVNELGRLSYPADSAQLTVAATVDAQQETLSITPPNNASAWSEGREIAITDTVGPGKPDASGIRRPYRVWGRIVSQSGSSVTVGDLEADGHVYPIGSAVEPQHQDYGVDPLNNETGDSLNPSMEELLISVGMRQGVKHRDESFDITVDCAVPLIDLQLGTWVYLTGISYDAWGNDLWIKAQVEEVAWRLKSWTNVVERSSDGTFQCKGTRLVLSQR